MVVVQKRKIRWSISLFLVMLYFSGLPAQAQYGGGSGEPNDPYLIYTAEQMNAIGADANDWDKHFLLIADINLADYTGTKFNIIGNRNNPFNGIFNGNNHTICNFTYTTTATTGYIGLFGCISHANAIVENLTLTDPNVNTTGYSGYVGSLVGWLGNGTISGCSVEGGSVSGYDIIGGLAGLNFYGEISNCYATDSVWGVDDRIGGLVGENCHGKISNCSAAGSVWGVEDRIGGLVGSNSGTISSCYATGNVSGYSSIGGLVGSNSEHITNVISNCYATGSVSGDYSTGGLAGVNYKGTISNCYATGAVDGDDYTAGLVGHNEDGTISDSFWDIQTSGRSNMCGGQRATWAGGCDDANGKTTAEMQTESTFTDAGWDFVGEFENGPSDHWAEPAGGGYPILWWQLSPLPELPTFSDGTGEPNDPYLISTAEDLDRIGRNPRLMGAHFKLISDIDLTSMGFFIIGSKLFPFAGVFDGNGHTISNFTYTSTGEDYIGLFCYVDGADIKDLGLIDPDVEAGTGNWVGLLIGKLSRGTVTNCYVQGGGVLGNEWVGGLVGENDYGTISNCYATGSVSGNRLVGGLVGYNEYGAVTSSFWDIETSGQTTSDWGTGKTTAEMQMESTFTDAGWDFVGESENGTEDIWSICEGTNYPRLAWQIPAGDFVCPDGITIDDFEFFTEHWLDDNCDISNDYCQGTDLDFSGTVDANDLSIFFENWLEGGND